MMEIRVGRGQTDAFIKAVEKSSSDFLPSVPVVEVDDYSPGFGALVEARDSGPAMRMMLFWGTGDLYLAECPDWAPSKGDIP